MCKSICYNNDVCTGVYWGFQSGVNKASCWLEIPTHGPSNSLTNANHWTFSNCTDECFPYCWKPKWEFVHTTGGVLKSDALSEEQCKEMCSKNQMCDGADWNEPDKSCYHLFRHSQTVDPIDHWEIVRNLNNNCTKDEPQCMPHCWTKNVSRELSIDDGLYIKGVDSEKNCKDICASNQTCIGVYWGLNQNFNFTSCYLQMPSDLVSESLTNVNHWTLSNCTDDCLPYCWMPKWDYVRVYGGVYQDGIDQENWCKLTCVHDNVCTGVDFNRNDSTCYFMYHEVLIQTPTPDPVHHWEVERNFPTICPNATDAVHNTTGPNMTVEQTPPVDAMNAGVTVSTTSAAAQNITTSMVGNLTELQYNETDKCKPRCWNKTLSQDVTFTDGLHREGIDTEKACKDVCVSNETCIGVYWGFSLSKNINTCWLQVSGHGTSDSLDDANHWHFSNCTDDCVTYCWEPKVEHVKTDGGIYESMAQTEDKCKTSCANDEVCDGVDWSDLDQSCWFLFIHRRVNYPAHHWEIIRNLPTNCSEKDEMCTPNCWKKTEALEMSINDGLLKEGLHDENNCKDVCANNQTCTGVYWGFSPRLNTMGCWLQMPSEAVAESLTKVTHWSLSGCTDDCLPYCWLPKWEFVHMLGGIVKDEIEEENVCKVTCAHDTKCKGIDFNGEDTTCYLLFHIELIQTPTSDPVHHWEIERNSPNTCSKEPSVVGVLPSTAEASTDENATDIAVVSHTTATKKATVHTTTWEPPERLMPKVAESKKLRSRAKKDPCPHKIAAIFTMSGLLGLSLCIMVGLIWFISAKIPREEVQNIPDDAK